MRRLLFLLWLGLVLAGAPARATECSLATEQMAKAHAERAAAFMRVHGPEAAFAAFMNRNGPFIAGDLYVFVLDFEGTLRASGAWQESVGARIYFNPDGNSTIVGEILRVAREQGQGWVEYSWFNPCNRQRQPKASYVIRVGEFIVGVGAYKRPGV